MFKRIARILAVAVAIAGAQTVQAADIGLKDGPTRISDADPINWAGLSFGVQALATSANHDIKIDANDGKESFGLFHLDGLSSQGLGGSLYAQYDFQFGDIVAGIRGFYSLTNADTTLSVADGLLTADLTEQDRYGAVVRLGRLLGDDKRALLYALGGWEWGSYELRATLDIPATKTKAAVHEEGSESQSYNGPVAGIGLEYALTHSIFASIEYMHWWAGEQDWSKTDGITAKDALNVDTVSAGLRVKF